MSVKSKKIMEIHLLSNTRANIYFCGLNYKHGKIVIYNHSYCGLYH